MSLLNPTQHRFLTTLGRLSYCNPFLPERIELEREALGSDFEEPHAVWSRLNDWELQRPNVDRLQARSEQLARDIQGAIEGGKRLEGSDAGHYEDLVAYVLYNRYVLALADVDPSAGKVSVWKRFLADHQAFHAPTGMEPTTEAAHLFACCFQVCRAFRNIFYNIIGSSLPAARLRAEVWQSIFTHDMRRYKECLFSRMGDFTTLITGPSGTGKELVAAAIARSRYIPFDPETARFQGDCHGEFFPLNLSALSPTLIESELFGHRKGSFTGAIDDRVGWLDTCPPLGSVFLDEVGDLDPAIQVKLLRVLQTRTFQRLGESAERRFEGKIIAATHQDLPRRIEEGTFRRDFFFRLCSDMITTPSLRDQLSNKPDDLANLIESIVERVVGPSNERLCCEIVEWIESNLGADYGWPGNFRELEQCVRNIIVRGCYTRANQHGLGARQRVHREIDAHSLTADELVSRYVTLIYSQNRNYEETARQVKLDRRTVKSKIDPSLLEELS